MYLSHFRSDRGGKNAPMMNSIWNLYSATNSFLYIIYVLEERILENFRIRDDIWWRYFSPNNAVIFFFFPRPIPQISFSGKYICLGRKLHKRLLLEMEVKKLMISIYVDVFLVPWKGNWILNLVIVW